MCPSAPKGIVNASDQDNPDAKPDGGWSWTWGPQPQVSTYGNNILLGGGNAAGWPDDWVSRVPTESEVRLPSKVIYIVDARWVDLAGGWHPGRIGMAKLRHHDGAQTVCCDGHARWVPVKVLLRWPDQPDDPLHWDYR